MKNHHAILIAQALALAAVLAGPVAYAEVSDDQQLQDEQQNIDNTAKRGAASADKLAKEFDVTTDTVTGLRDEKRGWGEIIIELAMAQQLTKTNPTTYPDMESALAKIESIRTTGEGWGLIAKSLGFKLGPVVSAVQRARHDVIQAGRTERAETKDKTDRYAMADRTDRGGRPDRPDRSERPERQGRPEHGGRF